MASQETYSARNYEIYDRNPGKENLLKRDFSAEQPLRKFLTDITEIQCADGKLYVSPVMDCFSGDIVNIG